MNPTPGDVHVNTVLTNISVAYAQDQSNFVATKVFPVVPVEHQTNSYFVFDRTDFNRDEMEKRAPATESKGGGFRLSTDTYKAAVWSFHKDLDDQTMANTDIATLDQSATEYVTMKALIRKEKLFVTSFMSGSIWNNNQTGVSSSPGANQILQWNDDASNPIKDIDDAVYTGLLGTGFSFNTLVVGFRVFQRLKNHPDIIDRVKYTQNIGPNGTVKVSEQALAGLFGVDNFYVMKAIENTGKEGAAEANSFIGGNKALLTYVPARPGIQTPSGGYTFSWTGYMGATQDGTRIKRFRMEQIESDRIEINAAFDMKLISADLGVFFDTVVS